MDLRDWAGGRRPSLRQRSAEFIGTSCRWGWVLELRTPSSPGRGYLYGHTPQFFRISIRQAVSSQRDLPQLNTENCFDNVVGLMSPMQLQLCASSSFSLNNFQKSSLKESQDSQLSSLFMNHLWATPSKLK
ncbi:hypothetical protein LAZ67_11001795 [Cordylochernes scorpioides]|uniref:Uncharacterized protein n=1 Tax=Cordylochernes scorpioides TaxID=51811 RepID=A0ABY6KYQ2_9ARAC|nr:hypothetical protein LAZ67_11001795 [Cordylochernes scorpioides]